MSITLTNGFNIKGKEVVDARMVLSKKEMLNIKKTTMPEKYFCLCSDDSSIYVYDKSNEYNDETGLFKKISKASILEEDIISGITVGGINANTKIKSGVSLTDLFKILLNKYDLPIIKLKSGLAVNYVENGNPIDQTTIDIEVIKGTNEIKKINIIRDNENIYEFTENISDGCVLNQNIDNINSDTIITIEVDDGSLTTKLDIMYIFTNPYYYGTSITDNIDDSFDISKLNKLVQPKSELEISFTSNNEYLIIMLDKTYGELKDISDGNFSNLSSFNKKEISINNVDYLVYVSETPVTCNNFKYILKTN